ncbi:hypothetical protein QQF64_004138 [Cirrhinus molitorella]|uniref:Uncharacterized protein n=1 Tax=Cirrhinus molitorella TaxID=172907 RepID=A0ABR3MFC0_9TELE
MEDTSTEIRKVVTSRSRATREELQTRGEVTSRSKVTNEIRKAVTSRNRTTSEEDTETRTRAPTDPLHRGPRSRRGAQVPLLCAALPNSRSVAIRQI